MIFDLKIKDPSDFGDLFDDLDHTRGSDLFNGDLDLKITLFEDHFNAIRWDLSWINLDSWLLKYTSCTTMQWSYHITNIVMDCIEQLARAYPVS